jgi:Kef-type K+ transport system membrane component KefB
MAKLAGYLSYRLGQPAVLGELSCWSACCCGPSLLDFLHLSFFTIEAHTDQVIHELAEFGVLLLMFIAGLDLHLSDLVKSGKVSALAGTLGVVAPMGMGYGLGKLFGMADTGALFVGLTLAATSVSISAQTLMELNVLRSRVGVSLLGAAVFDDILVVLGLSIFLALTGDGGGSGLGAIVLTVLRMAAFILIGMVIGIVLIPDRLVRWTSACRSARVDLVVFAVMLLYAWSAEVLGGMAAITGGVPGRAGLRTQPAQRSASRPAFRRSPTACFVPIFFVNIGLVANAREPDRRQPGADDRDGTVAIVSKVLGAGLGARLGGLTNREALQLGVGMMSRGEVGLIVVTVASTTALIEPEVFAAVVGVVI